MTGGYLRYDYAWKTPGWTAQNPSFNTTETDGYYDPGLPEDVSKVRVWGEFGELDTGRDLGGVLRLRMDKILVHVPTGRQIIGGGFRPIRFRRDGFSIYLPATDDPDLIALDGEWEYQARLTVRGKVQEFSFALPAAEPEVNVLDLITPVS